MSAAIAAAGARANKGLLWKESRQLLPLITVLLGVGLMLIVAWNIMPSDAKIQINVAGLLPFLLPALYCVGAPAVLVCQERELRTMNWLTSLPIDSHRLIRMKVITAIGGLIVMWIVCWMLFALQTFILGRIDSNWLPLVQRNSSGALLVEHSAMWHLNSFYILMCAFFTAWRIRNTFASLVAILPLALVPTIITWIGYSIWQTVTGRFPVDTLMIGLPMIVLILMIGVMYWIGRRTALGSLAPESPPMLPDDRLFPDSLATIDWPETRTPMRHANTSPNRFATTALLWQMVRCNRIGLMSLIGMMLFGCWGWIVRIGHMFQRGQDNMASFAGQDDIASFAICVVAVSISWLGVFAFSGDAAPARLRFLADRGISPTRVWFARHLLSLSILGCVGLLSVVGALWYNQLFPNDRPRGVISLATVCLVCLSIYSVSQWTAQISQLLAVSSLLAPLLSVTIIYWLIAATIMFNMPGWMILPLVLLPMLATWISMPRYMDGLRDRFRWSIAAATILIIAVAPMVPMFARVMQVPRVDGATIDKRLTEAMQIDQQATSTTPIQLIAPRRFGPNAAELSEHVGMAGFDLQDLDDDSEALDVTSPSDPIDPATIPSANAVEIAQWNLDQAFSHANLAKLGLQSDPENDDSLALLGRWIELLSVSSQRLREAARLRESMQADSIEIWLTRTLAMPELQGHLDKPFASEAMERLRDTSFRDRTRRRAVLATWYHATGLQSTVPNDGTFGDYRLFQWKPNVSHYEQLAMQQRIADTVADAMLLMIEAGSRGESTEPMRRRLHQWFIGAKLDFENGPYADRFRAGRDNHSISMTLESVLLNFPASQWYAGWEDRWSQ